MSRYDRELEEFADMLIAAADHIRHSISVMSCNSCNNCEKKLICKYLPDYGAMVRINCPLWAEMGERKEE